MRKVAYIIVALFAVTGYAQFEHPDLKSGKKQVHSVLLLPVQAEINRVSMKGPEPMIEESRRVEHDLSPVIVESLRKVGCTVDEKTLAIDVLANDQEMRVTVDDLQKRYDEEMKMMYKKSKDVRKGRYTLGDSVAKLPAGEKYDALLFVRGEGQVLTGGKKAFGWLVTGQVFDMVQVTLGLVDAKTGEVLYFAKPIMLKNMAKDTADLHTGIERSFKNFAKVNKAAPVADENKQAEAK